ncbi:MAG TPA: hypothetical protein VH880_14420, partial [Anaeromyxobacteraceae bacterium]
AAPPATGAGEPSPASPPPRAAGAPAGGPAASPPPLRAPPTLQPSAPAPARDASGEPPPPMLQAAPPSAAFTIREASPAPAAGAAWPAGVPGGPEAEVRLAAAAASPVASSDAEGRIAQALSDLERRALAGQAVPLDAAVLRRAAALRLRVALALESAPPPGALHDAAAVQSLLAEIDAVLASLKEVGAAVPAPTVALIDALRNALVKEAVDLTDAVHRIAPQAPPPHAPSIGERRPARREEHRAAEPTWAPARVRARGRWALPALLAASAVAAAAYHGWQLLQRRSLAQRIQVPGAPAGMRAIGASGAPVLVDEERRTPHPAVLQRFKEEQAARGRTVLEAGPGVLLVVPEPPAPASRKPEGGKP